MLRDGTYVRVIKPGDMFNGRIGVVIDESPYSFNAELGRRYIIKFSENPFGFGFEERYLEEV